MWDFFSRLPKRALNQWLSVLISKHCTARASLSLCVCVPLQVWILKNLWTQRRVAAVVSQDDPPRDFILDKLNLTRRLTKTWGLVWVGELCTTSAECPSKLRTWAKQAARVFVWLPILVQNRLHICSFLDQTSRLLKGDCELFVSSLRTSSLICRPCALLVPASPRDFFFLKLTSQTFTVRLFSFISWCTR